MFRRLLPLLLVGALSVLAAPVHAEIPGPGWELTATTFPTNLRPGGGGTIDVNVFNVGAVASSGTITVTDALPEGVIASEAGELHFAAGEPEAPFITNTFWECAGNGPGKAVAGATVVTCTNTAELSPLAGGGGLPNSRPGE